MACVTCNTKHKGLYLNQNGLNNPPYGSTDIMVYENGIVKKFQDSDWSNKTHKLLIFFPETHTPVCSSELGALNDWIEPFKKINCEIIAATSDPIHMVEDWFTTEDTLSNPQYRILSSYILPTRIGVMYNGRAKRASVFIANNGDTIVQEHFLKVGRNLAELHRTMWAYTQDSYCGEGWTNPMDNMDIK